MLKNDGFTLLEVMIAIGILAIGIGAILVAENNSLDITLRAKRMTTVSMLAKNKLIEAERLLEGKDFKEVKEESTGKFDAPFAEYQWAQKIKEITFPSIASPQGGASGTSGTASTSSDSVGGAGLGGIDQNAERIVKLATQFLSKASREVSITISWTEKGKKQEFSVSQYWVDLNHEFSLSEQ